MWGIWEAADRGYLKARPPIRTPRQIATIHILQAGSV
jgi:hypothetical protein